MMTKVIPTLKTDIAERSQEVGGFIKKTDKKSALKNKVKREDAMDIRLKALFERELNLFKDSALDSNLKVDEG